ncbi:hypothetical protein TSA6c_17245 [Azospirillum sp. TSA6c]|uniref:hypothetical protein n=1 Tax=Azospirillum sp. TSA6c TaxID=709813 RepID=UPI000D612275|nr:hypothetical protein [Azospirillum sp. TSA6c]PWC48171.1 hypothetical protein TSA6c_17245 [Azospirillum sp. TSA6c]
MTAQLPLHSAGSLPAPPTATDNPLTRLDSAATAAVRALAVFAHAVAASGGNADEDVDRVWLIGTELGAIAQRAVERAATGNLNQGEG